MSSAALHDAVRQESKPGLWSQGVKLARAGAVAIESRTAQEVVLRVRTSRPVPYTVVVYPGDLAWECNCDGRIDPCEHVCAAAIALQTQGEALATSEQRWARVLYRFGRVSGGLQLIRELDGQELQSLAALLQTAEGKARIHVEQHDLAVDRLLARPRRGILPPDLLHSLLAALQ